MTDAELEEAAARIHATGDTALVGSDVRDFALAVLERLRCCERCTGEPHKCDQERVAAAEGRTDRLILELESARRERDAAVLSTQVAIAGFVSDSLDWDRSNDAALYGIADSIESGAWKEGAKR